MEVRATRATLAGAFIAACLAFLPRSISQDSGVIDDLSIEPAAPTTFIEGQTGLIRCVSRLRTNTLLVRYSPSKLQPAQTIRTGYTERHTVSQNVSGSDVIAMLVISPVALSDAGTYYCVDPQNFKAIVTTIYVVPKAVEPELPPLGGATKRSTTIEACGIYFNNSFLYNDVLDRNLTTEGALVEYGGDVIRKFETTYVLACRFRVVSLPTTNASLLNISWLRNGVFFATATVVSANGTVNPNITVTTEFRITKDTAPEDFVGLYHLSMNGTIVNTDTLDYPLNFYTPPTTSLTRSTWEAFSDSSTNIACVVDRVAEQNISVHVKWLRDGKYITSANVADAPVFLQRHPDENQPFWTVLRMTFSDLKSSDRHWYTCVGEIRRYRGDSLVGRSESKILLRVRDPLGALWPFIGILVMAFLLALILYADESWQQRKTPTDEPDGGEVEEEEDEADYPEDFDDQRLKELLSGTPRSRSTSMTLGRDNGTSEKKPLLAANSDADLRQKLHGTSI